MKESEDLGPGVQDKTPGSGKWLIGGGLAAAFAATLCCLGPLIFAGLGLGAFAAAGFFHEMRPLFLGLALLFVAAAWIWDWRKSKKASCETPEADSACETGCARRLRTGLVLFTVVALLLGASPYLLEGWVARTGGAGTNTAANETANEVSDLAIWDAELEGLYCPSCTPGLQRAFQQVDGVDAAEVTYRPQRAVVRYDPERVNAERFREIVDEFGYRVVDNE